MTTYIIETYGCKEKAKTKLAELGLKPTPPRMLLSEIVQDLCLQTPLGTYFILIHE